MIFGIMNAIKRDKRHGLSQQYRTSIIVDKGDMGLPARLAVNNGVQTTGCPAEYRHLYFGLAHKSRLIEILAIVVIGSVLGTLDVHRAIVAKANNVTH